jgi:hypothetical protein
MLKKDKMLDMVAAKMGVPQAILNSPAERAMMLEQMQQVAQQNPEVAAAALQQAQGGALQ